ncbi:MAG: hypothetical protein GW771_01460 [Flavobacteriia bacterium]|nr:hypothetical protein [Flavobacteriia bacterium]
MKNQLFILILLFGCVACYENQSQKGNKSLDAVIENNSNVKENLKHATSKANDAKAIATWFPEKWMMYQLDTRTIELGKGAESPAKATYTHPQDSKMNVTLEVWDGNGPATLAVKNMIALSLGEKGEESTSQMRQKVYERKGRTSAEREIYQNKQVNISFEVEERFFTTLRSDNNSLETLWQMADLLDFSTLK